MMKGREKIQGSPYPLGPPYPPCIFFFAPLSLCAFALCFCFSSFDAAFQKPPPPLAIEEHPEHVALLHLDEVVLALDRAPPPAAREDVGAEKVAHRTEFEPPEEPAVGLVARARRRHQGVFVEAADEGASWSFRGRGFFR